MEASALTVSIRDQVVPVRLGKSLFDVLRSIEMDTIEARVLPDESLPHVIASDGSPFSIGDDNSIRNLTQRLESERIRISSLLLATDFCSADADRHVEWAARAIRAAWQIGANVVRIDPLTARMDLDADAICDNFIRRTVQVLAATADVPVDLGMENHGRIFNDPAVIDRMLAAIPDPRFGLTLDTGNFYWWGHPLSRVYELIERYAPRTRHTHIKSIHYPPDLRERQREIGFEYKTYCCPLHEGDLDLRRIVQILRQSGYRRDLCIEDESLFKSPEEDRAGILRQEATALRNAVG